MSNFERKINVIILIILSKEIFSLCETNNEEEFDCKEKRQRIMCKLFFNL